jgi:hypothetical protein
VRRLVSWAHDEPIWRMAEREHCSVRTNHSRIDRSVAAIQRFQRTSPVPIEVEDAMWVPDRWIATTISQAVLATIARQEVRADATTCRRRRLPESWG